MHISDITTAYNPQLLMAFLIMNFSAVLFEFLAGLLAATRGFDITSKSNLR